MYNVNLNLPVNRFLQNVHSISVILGTVGSHRLNCRHLDGETSTWTEHVVIHFLTNHAPPEHPSLISTIPGRWLSKFRRYVSCTMSDRACLMPAHSQQYSHWTRSATIDSVSRFQLPWQTLCVVQFIINNALVAALSYFGGNEQLIAGLYLNQAPPNVVVRTSQERDRVRPREQSTS